MLSISLARGLDDSLDSFLLPTLFLLASAAGFNGLFYWQLVVHIYLALVIFPGPPNSRRRCLSRMRIPCASAQFSQHRKGKTQKKIKPRELAKFTRPTCNPCRQIPDLPCPTLPLACHQTATTHTPIPTPDSLVPIPLPIPRDSFAAAVPFYLAPIN